MMGVCVAFSLRLSNSQNNKSIDLHFHASCLDDLVLRRKIEKSKTASCARSFGQVLLSVLLHMLTDFFFFFNVAW